jgi:hypothetical protein
MFPVWRWMEDYSHACLLTSRVANDFCKCRVNICIVNDFRQVSQTNPISSQHLRSSNVSSFIAQLVDAKLSFALHTTRYLFEASVLQGFVIPVNIRVTDANDNAPQFVNAPYVLNISEVCNTTNITYCNVAHPLL